MAGLVKLEIFREVSMKQDRVGFETLLSPRTATRQAQTLCDDQGRSPDGGDRACLAKNRNVLSFSVTLGSFAEVTGDASVQL